MIYLVIAYDHGGEEALARRMQVRQLHLDLIRSLRDERKALFGSLLKSEGTIKGSVLCFDFEAADLEAWKKNEPYITHGVWETVQIYEGAVPDFFTTAKE